MPDIAMCANKSCPSRLTCYRFTATPGKWQFYAGFVPDESGKCEWYMLLDIYQKYEDQEIENITK